MNSRMTIVLGAVLVASFGWVSAQQPAAPAGAPVQAGRGGGRGGGGAAQQWWVHKSKGGVYPAPMKPLWKISDLKKKYVGRNNWREQIILDPEQDATYNSAAPGTKFSSRLHPDTHTLFVVTAGEMHFDVEGQPPVTATRGSIVNVLKSTVFSYEVSGTQNALWIEVDPPNYKTVYPAADPEPAPIPGTQVIKVAFNHTPAAYAPPNQVHWNLFEAAAKCNQAGPKVNEDGLFANPLYGFADPNDPLNTCGTAARGGGGAAAPAGGRGAAAPEVPFNPNSTFGHMHPGPAEWWIVQVGHIRGRFESTGDFHAEEGDVLYAAPMTWHQMGFEGAGPSCRLAMGGYSLINMNNTETSNAGQ